ncbi:DNA-binding MarR family transcriptional regulator [Hydrogenoanaerobacterium saccharovorans]|uniref:DNA-binding transcriptional regulator, MarR family n=1 Tax=Hydrogenoanaerobacterium saccharovorans TaxID=474960 RepID=A0A1H7ZSH8_9FIRM|nr:MarR family transcriptional regulator [Hydrogenoanaerobacterium saccharovorans]RPF48463.1 DNA-binding MarR family transcriptional regulator [Hydrogenoanaerobacterium saccharovorans]SEM60449.1 DNA-binding transcriptional regulator, MarR family [Hydrogenoanaerobacterium saccharovorans]
MEQNQNKLADEILINLSQMKRLSFTKTKHNALLKHGERAVLFCVQCSKEEKMKSTEIAAALNVAASGITPILNRLEKKGYILRSLDVTDRRVIIISLTELGKQVLEDTIDELRTHIKEVTDYLGEKDSTELLRITNRLLQYYTSKRNNQGGSVCEAFSKN